jgi:hypothetical protein
VAEPDEANEGLPGALNDVYRIDFYRSYMQAAMAAVSEDQARAAAFLSLGRRAHSETR